MNQQQQSNLTEEQLDAIWTRLESPCALMFCDNCTVELTHSYYQRHEQTEHCCNWKTQRWWYLFVLAAEGEL